MRHLQLKSVAVNVRSIELSISMKQDIIRLKKIKIKPIGEIAKTLVVANKLCGRFSKQKNSPASSAIPKDPEDLRHLYWLTEGLHSRKVQEVVEVVCVSKSTIKRRLHRIEYIDFPTRW